MWIRQALLVSLLLAVASVVHAGDRSFEKTVKADPHGAVRVSNVAGKVQVIGWDRAEVEVKAQLSGDIERVDVLNDNGRTTIIKVILPRSSHDGTADLEIHVPLQSDVAISAVSADVETQRVLGPQHLTTVSGEIRAEFAKDFEGKTVSGDLRLKGQSENGAVHVSSVSGNVFLERAGGDVEVTSVSGDLLLDVASVTTVRTRTTSGDVSLRGALASDGNVDADTISGDITVRVKPQAGFEYEATSFSGTIGNCFGRHVEHTSTHGPGTRLIGSAGEGRGRVRVKSMSGNVAICDR